MKGWFTARAIAEFSLPGLPSTKRGVNLLAAKEKWSARLSPAGEALSRQSKGGMEYHISLLPQAARAALSAQATKIDTTQPVAAPLPAAAAPASADRLLRRDARLALLTYADAHFANNRLLGRVAADADFAARYRAGTIEVDAWLKAELPKVSLPSLRRWRKDRDAGNWHQVGGAGRKASNALTEAEDGDVAHYMGGLMVAQPFLNASHLRHLVEARFGAALRLGTGEIPLPHERSFQRFIAQWKEQNATALRSLTDPDAFKSATRLAGKNAYQGITRLNELWEIDASPADVLLKEGRHSIYALVDVFSRRMVISVSKTPRTEATLLLLRKAILQWGVPETLRTDNGTDFTSHAFKRALHALGIMHDITAPFSPEQKGIVERAIGTLQRDLMPLLPGFIGHSVADRSRIEERKAFAARLGEDDASTFKVELTAAEMQAICDDWANAKYANRVHRALGVTPAAKALSAIGSIRTITNIRALDLLLAPVIGGWRVVTKRGIQLDGAHYISGALLAGRRVFCRQDADDLGRLLVFEDEHGAFICEAICPERAGVDPRAVIAAARAEQTRMVKEGTAELRAAAKAIKPRHMVDAVLGLARDKAIEEASNVARLPRREEAHETGALDAAAEAVDSNLPTPFETPFEAPSQPPAAGKVVALPETDRQRFRRALSIMEALAAGRDVEAKEALWLGEYRTTAEFKAQEEMARSFGSEWLTA